MKNKIFFSLLTVIMVLCGMECSAKTYFLAWKNGQYTIFEKPDSITFLDTTIKLDTVVIDPSIIGGQSLNVNNDCPEKTWQKVYQNDENGNTVSGSKQALIAATLLGMEVKVAIVYPNNPGQTYLTPAENVWIRDGEVTIQNASQISVRDDLTIQSDPYYWIVMLNTKGVINTSRWALGEHRSKGNGEDHVRVTWFVR